MPTFTDRLSHAWNAFLSREPTNTDSGPGAGAMMSSYRPDRILYGRGADRHIVNAVMNRMAMDAAATTIFHAKLDDNGRFKEQVQSGLNNCLTVEANIDQSGRAFLHDIFASMLDEGVVAIVPIETNLSPLSTGGYNIESLRTGRITAWYPSHVRVLLYNEKIGRKVEVTLPKSMVAICENPFFPVMNEKNSTLQRLARKLALLDVVDEQAGAGKLDLIIQLPYAIKSEARRAQAETRRKDIETQLAGSKYGIAYTDATERITQLNRSLENNLLKQVEFLTSTLYSQLGLTTGIMDGTANAEVMTNYYNRTIEPIVTIVCDEMRRKFLTKTARTQNQTIYYFRDPFRLVPVNQLADIADRFTRNEIMSPNELRQIVGLKPSDDAAADELRNRNINQANGMMPGYIEMNPDMMDPNAMQEEGVPQSTPYDPSRPLSEQIGL